MQKTQSVRKANGKIKNAIKIDYDLLMRRKLHDIRIFYIHTNAWNTSKYQLLSVGDYKVYKTYIEHQRCEYYIVITKKSFTGHIINKYGH